MHLQSGRRATSPTVGAHQVHPFVHAVDRHPLHDQRTVMAERQGAARPETVHHTAGPQCVALPGLAPFHTCASMTASRRNPISLPLRTSRSIEWRDSPSARVG